MGPMRLREWFLVVAALVIAQRPCNGVPLSSFYSYGSSAGDNNLPANDDGYTSLISLATHFPYFGQSRSGLYVNNNGVISFNSPVSSYYASAFPYSGAPLITPYWGDVDTRGTGSVWYRETNNYAQIQKAQSDVRAIYSQFQSFTPTRVFIATWHYVGYYNRRTDRTNTFQCILITDGTYSFVVFLYGDNLINWSVGQASSIHAQVGFNAGDGVRHYTVSGSRTSSIVNIETTSNIGVAGKYIFRVDDATIATPPPEMPPSLTSSPSSTTVVAGSSPSFSCSATGLPLPSISWRRGSTTISSGSHFSISSSSGSSTLRIYGITLSDAGGYSCYASNSQGSLTSSFTITVQAAPAVSASVTSVSAQIGASATLSCSVTASPLATPYWQKGGTTVTTNSRVSIANSQLDSTTVRSTLSLTSLQSSDGGTYNCLASNSVGSGSVGISLSVLVPLYVTIGTAVTGTVGSGSTNNYQFNFPSNGITIILNVGSGTINCYASDQYPFPTSSNYDWTISVSGYANVFIDPDLIGRAAGSYMYVALQGAQSSNTFTLNTATGDRRAPQVLSFDVDVSISLSSYQRLFYQLVFANNGVTLRLTVTSGTIICYASDLTQNPTADQGYVWTVTTSGYIDIFLDPSTLNRAAGSTLYIALEGSSSNTNSFTFSSSTGDRRLPATISLDQDVSNTVSSGYLVYYRLPFPASGITLTLTVSYGRIICYASDSEQNPNNVQGYEWRVETTGTVEVFIDPDSLDTTPGAYLYIGFEGGSSNNGFGFSSTSGDRRTPQQIAVNGTSTDTVGDGDRIYFQFPFPSYGVTLQLTVSTGYVICYASDRYQNPNEAQGYDWRVEVSGFANVFLDPALLSRTPGTIIYVAIEGSYNGGSSTFTLGNTEGDRRVPTTLSADTTASNTVGMGERVYYRFNFPSTGLTIRLNVGVGYIVCYASDSNQNPNAVQGYDWRVETSGYIDTFIDPTLLGRPAGQYVYISLEGSQSSNSFSVNSSSGDRRVPSLIAVDVDISATVSQGELSYYRYVFSQNGLTIRLNIGSGYVICYASDTNQNPNSRQGYSWIVTVTGFSDVYIDPLLLGRQAGEYLYIGIEGGQPGSNNFLLSTTDGDRRVPTVVGLNFIGSGSVGTGVLQYFRFQFPTNGLTLYLSISSGTVICYASDQVQNPNSRQTYIWLVQTSGYANVFIDPLLLGRSAGAYIYIGIEGVDGTNTFTVNNTDGDKRAPTSLDVGVVGTGSVDQGVRLFYRFPFPTVGLTIRLTVTSGSVVCYASDRYRNPTSTQGYDWRVETDGYTDVYIDPELLNRDAGPYIYVAIEGLESDCDFTLNSTEGDRRVPYVGSLGVSVTSTLVYKEVVYYRFPFPTNGLTFVLEVSVGSVICYASNSLQNPGRKYGYIWRVEADSYNDSYVDPSTIQGTVGAYIYIGIDGRSINSNNTFVLTATGGDTSTKVPNPPTSLQTTGSTATSINVTWQAPVAAIVTPISGIQRYKLKVYEYQFNLATIYVNTSQLYYVFTNLEEYSNYSCEIAAVNRVGEGQYGSPFNFSTLQAAPSGPPQGVTGTSASTTLITLEWLLPTSIHINGVITKYVVKVVEVYTGQIYNLFTENMHINIGPLHPYYIYECSVAAHTIATGVFSSPINITTQETVPTGAPLNITAADVGPRYVLLRWQPPQFDLQNGRIRQYLIQVIHNRTGLTYTVVSSTNQYRLENLFPFHTYIFSIAAETVGLGPYSTQITVTTLEAAPGTPPESVSGYVINSTSVFLGWEQPSADSLNGILRGYQINCTEVDTSLLITVSLEGLLTETIVSNLHPAYTYTCRVSAVTVDVGVFSGNITLEMDEADPSGPPLNLGSTTVLARSVTLTWGLPQPEDRNGQITGYTVKVEHTDTGEASLFTTIEISYTVQSLTPYQNYEFSVAATTAIGQGPFTLALSLRTAEDVPGAPQSPDAEKVPGSPNELVISWDPPTEPNGIITSYKVYCYDSEDGPDSVNTTTSEAVSTIVSSSDASEATVPGLTPYAYYSCYVTATTSIGEGDISDSTRARTDESTPATTPQNLSASAADANSLTVSWSDPDTPYGVIISYTVTYNISGVSTSFVTESQSVTLENLDEYTVYAIYVAASTRIGTGPSTQVYGRTDQAKPHSPPTSIQVPSTDKRAATISWQPPVPEDRNGIITHYVIVLSNLDFSVDDVIANVSGSLLSYTVQGLEEYSTHECRIAAGTIVGTGPYSSPIELTTMQDAPSASPRSLSGSAQSTTLIDLTWDPPPAIDTNGVIQYYSIRVLESETSRSWSFVHVESDNEITVGSLHPYYNYQCRVAAYTVGLGPYTDEILVQTEETVPTAAPLGLQANETGTHSLTLSWEPPLLENRNGQIRQYRVRVTGIENGETVQETSTTTQITITNLHPFYNYDCSVAAETIAIGPYSDSLLVQLDEYSPSAAPSNPTGQVIDSTTVSLSWDPPPVENRNGVIRKYIITATETNTGNEYSFESIATNFEVHSLHPFYTYEFAIAAFTVGQGPSTNPITLQTLHDIPSATPEGVTVGDVLSISFIISWQPPASEYHNGIIVGYTVKIVNLNTNDETQTNINETSLVVTGLTPFTAYEISIAAHNGAGRGPFSVSVTVETEETAPNAPPGDVSVSSLSSTVLQLSWSPPTAENSNGIIREYLVNLNELNTGTLLTYTTATTSITLQSLHPSYTYECTVSAYTVATGPFTQIFTITMPEDAPSGYPQDFSVTPTSPRSINLQWNQPRADEQNGIITGYTITQTELVTGEVNQFSTNATNLMLTNLSPYTTYTWVIAASTVIGQGPFSTTITLLMPEDVPTGAPQNISGVSTSSQSVYLTWNPPQASVQNGIIREYYINVLEVNRGLELQYITRTTEFEITELHPYYNYEISVSAYTIALGPSSELYSIQTLEDAPSGPPVNIIAEANSSRSITVQWSDPLPEQQNGLIVGYAINITSIAGGERLHFQTAQLNLTIGGLTPHTSYECIIAAMTTIGTGPFSSIITVRTTEEAPSGLPSNSSGEALNSTHILLTWDPPPPNQTHGDIQEYIITVIEQETGDTSQYSSNTTELIVGPLHPYYVYNCSIQAVTVEPGPPINIIVRTEEGAPSSPPTSFQVNVLSTTAIFFSWEPPPTEHHNGIIRRYLVVLESQDIFVKIRVFTTETSITVNNLHPYTVYNCTVAAETILIGVETDIQSPQTFESAPAVPPDDLSFVVVDSRSITLAWSAPSLMDRNGDIRQYLINITEIDTGNSWQVAVVDSFTTVESLHPFYSYSIIVAAETVALGPFTSPIIVEMPEDAPSSPPTDVSAGAITSDGFILSWNHPPEEDWNGQIRQFMVTILEENTGQEFQLTMSANEIEVTFLHPFYSYSCSVAAVSISPGPYSPPISVTTLSAAPTGPPQNIIALVVEATSLTLSWEPPVASEQNGIITSYDIEMTTETGEIFDFSTSSTTYTISNLEPYKIYQFVIAALTMSGQGPFSSDIAIRTGEADPTAPPENVTVTTVGSTYAELSWDAPDSSGHNGVIRFYTVLVIEVETETNVSLTSISTQITLTDLHPFYTYRISVAAVTISPGPYSVQVSLRTLQDVPNASPGEVGGEAISPSSLVLTWQPPPEDQLNGVLTGYLVNVTETETGVQYQISADTAQYTFEGLHPFYRYSFIVATITVGPGPFSGIFTIQMPQDAPSAPPQNVVGTVFNSSALSISWRPPPFGSQNGVIVGYTISILELVTSNLRTVETDGPHTEIFITSLHPYYLYEFTVAAQTVAIGQFSSRSTVRTDEDVPSGAPRNVTTTVLDSVTVELMWEPPPMDTHNGIIRQYSIDIYVSETRENFFKVMSDNSTSTVVTELHPYYTYSFKVAAVTTAAGPQSAEVTARTLENVPTGAPQSVEAVAVSSSSIRITWIPPLPEQQNGVIRAYHINVSEVQDGNGDGAMIKFETDGLTTIFIVNSLHPYYIYRIKISAYTVGLGPSVSVEERTHADVPTGAPENLTVAALNSSTVQVSWNLPQLSLQNGLIVDYVLTITGVDTDEEYELRSGEDAGGTMTVPGLHPFYTYTFSIAAATTVGGGPFSPAVAFQMPQEVCMDSVEEVSVEVESASSVTVSWLPPDSQLWNGIITSYTVVYELLGIVEEGTDKTNFEPISSQTFSIPQAGMPLVNNPDPRIVTSPLQFERAVIDTLEEFHVYRFKVYLENAVGQSDVSNLITVEMPPSAPDGPPLSVTVSALSSTSILITWLNPQEFDINGILTDFLLTITDSTGSELPLISLPATTYSYHREGLKKFEIYNVKVAAQNAQGAGPTSEPVTVRTLEDVPGAPVDVTIVPSNSTATAVTLKWSPPLSPNGIILYYKITFYGHEPSDEDSKDDEIVDKTRTFAVAETMILVTDLVPGLTYTFTIRANTSVGYGEETTKEYTVDPKVKVEETGGDNATIPVIAVVAIVAGLALIVLVVLVAIIIWRQMRRNGKLEMPAERHGFANPIAANVGEDEEDGGIFLKSYREINEAEESEINKKEDLGSKAKQDPRDLDCSTLKTESNF